MTIALTCEINIHLDDCYYDVEFNLSERRPLVVRHGLQQVQTTMHEPNAPDVGRESKEGEIARTRVQRSLGDSRVGLYK